MTRETNNMEKDLLSSIVEIMQNYFNKYRTLVPVASPKSVDDGLAIDPCYIYLLEANPKIFYKCTAKRYALVKWLFEIIEEMFKESNENSIAFENIYEKLRSEFKVVSMNRGQLKELLKEHSRLTTEKFYKLQKELIDYSDKFGITEDQPIFIKEKINLNDTLKVAINNIFNDQIYEEVVTGKMFNDSDLSQEEQQIISKINFAKEELGAENCVAFLKDSNFLMTTYKLFAPLENKYIEFKKNRSEIIESVGYINSANYGAKIEWLIKAYSLDNNIQITLAKIFEKYKTLNQIEHILSFCLNTTTNEIITFKNFIKWLSKDLRLYAYEELKRVFKDDRSKEIVLYRSQGYTLELTGKKFNLTRERVRQIEKKTIDRYHNYYISRIRPQYILLAFSDKDYVISRDLIESVFHDLANFFEYGLQTIKTKSAIWNDDIECFINNDANWYNYVMGCIDSFPEFLNVEELHQKVYELSNSLAIRIDPNIIKIIIEKSYKLIGNTYTKTKMSKNRMYKLIVEKYFPDGIRVFDDFEMMRFRNYLKEEFGNIEFANNRSVAMRMTDGLILCDRGKYILPEKINISEDLLQKIFNYVRNNSKNIIMYHELFEVFKEELLQNSNVYNRYFLQGVLKYKYPNSFIYTRDTICKESTEARSIRHEIEEFIKSANGVVTKDEIRAAFPGITDIVINLHTTGNENILLWDFGKYIHVSKLYLEDDIIDLLNITLKGYTKNGTVSVRKIYDELFNMENEFMISNDITNHIALFSLLEYLFGDEFEFSRPYIAPKNSTTLSEDALIREFVSSFDQLKISDLKTYLDDMHIRIMNYSALLDDLSEEFLRIDDDLLMRKDKLELSEETIDKIEKVLLALMGQARYISSRVLSDFFFFPNVGVKWTPFLLISIIKSFGKQVKVIDINTDYRYLNSIFVDNSLNILDYDSLLHHAIRKEANNYTFKNLTEIEKFLHEQGLISNNIPESLFEKRYLIIDDDKGIQIY